MANSDKNILITPNKNQGDQPSFSFIGAGNSSITLKVLDDSLGTLSFQNSGFGQVFSLDINITGLTMNSGSIFKVNDNNGLTKLSINTNFNTAVDLCPGEGQVRIHGHNYIESACFTLTSASRNNIISNNDGYVNFEISSDPVYFNTNPNVMQIFSDGTFGIKFTKPGIVHVGVSQDFITSSTSGYVALYFYVNDSLKHASLNQNTESQWDGYNAYHIMRVNANDVVKLRFLGTDFTAIDVGAWSYYTFLFFGLPL